MQSPSKSRSATAEREIKPKAANAVEAHKEKFVSKRSKFEEVMRGDQPDSRGMFDESFRVEETKTMETDYIESDRPRRPVIQSNGAGRRPDLNE